MPGFDNSAFLFISFLPLMLMSASLRADDDCRRAREIGINVGVMKTGELNTITDVPGVKVGHKTIIRGDNIRTGVTAVLPHDGNLYQEKVPAAISIGNGFGKLAGYSQVEELGQIETPIILTNTLSVGTAVSAVVKYTLSQNGNASVRSVNAVVGETNDGYLNDIRGLHVSADDVYEAINVAVSGTAEEGCVGAGTGTRAFGYKGGIGTSSRLVPAGDSNLYTVGVLVQSNYGGDLDINGAPVGRELAWRQRNKNVKTDSDGSCMIVIATDTPLGFRNLKRLARRAFHGLARTGSNMSNGSGEYAIAFSTAYTIPNGSKDPHSLPPLVPNDAMTPFFQAVIEATREAVYNSLLMAITTRGHKERTLQAIPIDEVIKICREYNILKSH
jgi:D-aminopeptidase